MYVPCWGSGAPGTSKGPCWVSSQLRESSLSLPGLLEEEVSLLSSLRGEDGGREESGSSAWASSTWGGRLRDGFGSSGLGGTVGDSGHVVSGVDRGRSWITAEERQRFLPRGSSGWGRAMEQPQRLLGILSLFSKTRGIWGYLVLRGEPSRSLGGRRGQDPKPSAAE